MTITELLHLLRMLDPNSVILNAPKNPHRYCGEAKGLALCMPTAYLMHSNDSSTVEKLLAHINVMATAYEIPFDKPVYVVEGMHQAGMPLKGLLLRSNGIRLVSE
jgi:hypothetical protein